MKSPTAKLAQIAFCGLLATPAIAAANTITLDRVGEGNEIGVQTGVAIYDDLDSVTFLRNDLYGRMVLGANAGVYFNVPISYAAVDELDDETALGNVELGGFYTQRLRDGQITYRLGLIAPTADDSIEGVLTGALTSPARLTDMATLAPDTLTLRLAASPRLNLGMAFVRADLGVDTLIPTDDNDIRDTEAFLRANVAAGVQIEALTVAAELANLGVLTEEADGLGERFLHTAALSASYDFGPVAAIAGLATPLDKGARGEIWVPTVGLSGQF